MASKQTSHQSSSPLSSSTASDSTGIGERTVYPAPFTYDGIGEPQLPTLTEKDLSNITSVLRGLSRGVLPRADAVPTALNAYNITQEPSKGKNAWAYFHSVTNIAAADEDGRGNREGWEQATRKPATSRRRAETSTSHIVVPDEVILDTMKEWHPIREGEEDAAGSWMESASYRFLCFIHSHRLSRGNSRRSKAIYTISIWDRQHEEMTWHDTCAYERSDRRAAIRHFWSRVQTNLKFMNPRKTFLAQIRFRTAYHSCEKLEAATRDYIDPPYTLWSVMAIGLQHMNRGGFDSQVSIVEDRLEVFSGHRKDLLPRLFVHLLHLFLYSPREGREEDWNEVTGGLADEETIRQFARRFRIGEKLHWMKSDGRKEMESLTRQARGAWMTGLPWLIGELRMC
ncbi:hypothetical protein GGS20DRAFT_582622 [Poronia punctata]|nr:hypothetical protein GGS20DRAFT_582622 [Poronia punctata]